MVLLIFKVVSLIVGAGAGYYLVNIFLTDYLKGNFLLIGQITGIIIFAFLGYLFGTLTGRRIIKDVTEVDRHLKNIPGSNLIIGLAGLTTGIVPGLVSVALRSIPFAGVFIPVFVVLIFSYAGIILALRNKELLVTIFKLNKKDTEYTGISDKEKTAMIVTEGGKKLVGREIEILITGILKTPAGRMIFSKAANGE